MKFRKILSSIKGRLINTEYGRNVNKVTGGSNSRKQIIKDIGRGIKKKFKK